MTTPTWASYAESHATTAKMKSMWEQYNGLYGGYRVNDAYWVGIGVNDLIRNIRDKNNMQRYVFVKWNNLRNNMNDDDKSRATLFLMLDTAYMSSSQVDIAQKYNDWNPNAV